MDTKPYEDKMAGAVEHFNDELKKLRTGRANAAMLDGISVEAYGTSMPLNQAATVNAVDAQLLQITPFDPSNLQKIVAAIRDNQSLGLNPSDDGRVVRVPIPPLNEERRRDLAKQIGTKQEDAQVVLRGIRRDAIDAIDKAKKAKDIGEDDAKRLQKDIDDAMAKIRGQIEAAAKAKEADIMKV